MTRFTDRFNLTFIRYLMVTVLNTLTTYALYLLGLRLMPYPLAYSSAYLAGIFIAYALNSLFVFRQPLSWKKALQYPLVYVVQYLLGLFMLTVLVEMLRVDAQFAALLNVVVTLPITYVLSRFILTRA